jgi:hypothetical protein
MAGAGAVILLLQSLLIAWLVAKPFGRSRILAIGLGLVALIPLHEGISTAMALRGLWGDPSITTSLLAILSLSNRLPPLISRGWRLPALFAVAGIAFYALVLGCSNLDLYRLGYQPSAMVGILSVLALLAWWCGHVRFVWLLALDLFAFAAGLHESPNLWDTLFDPLLVITALVLAVSNAWRLYKEKHER